MTAHTLGKALHQAVTDEVMIQSAERLGQQIRKENGVATAIEVLYRDLEYAKVGRRRQALQGLSTRGKLRLNESSFCSH